MKSNMLALLLVVHVFAVSLSACLCQSEGDIRLVGGTKTPSTTGRLDIFWNGKWGTFCELSKKSADAACLQLGFKFADKFGHYSSYLDTVDIPKASDYMPIALGSASCGDDLLGLPSHVLRCDYSTETSACNHEEDIVLECNPASIWDSVDDIYETELRIVSGPFPSTGTLEIFINTDWGNVCYSHFDQGAADSACRQLGYTNAASFKSTTNQSSSRVWLSEAQCKSQSCDCLYRCFDKPNAPTSCPDGNYLSIQCTFMASRASKLTPGMESACDSEHLSSCTGDIDDFTQMIILMVVIPIGILLLIFILVCSIIACVVFIIVRRQRHYLCCDSCCCRRRPRYNIILHPDNQDTNI